MKEPLVGAPGAAGSAPGVIHGLFRHEPDAPTGRMIGFHLHIVSDSTAETAQTVARAALARFDHVSTTEHIWPMARTEDDIRNVIAGIEDNPGFVLFTLVDDGIRQALEDACRLLKAPCVPVVDAVVAALGDHLGVKVHDRPGRQHVLDTEYFDRIEAIHYVIGHDDGQSTHDLEDADVILLGASRTSKTPTAIYLANRGVKAANIPIVPGCPVPDELFRVEGPLIIGLTSDPRRLVDIRRQRLRLLGQGDDTDYVDPESVTAEVNETRALFARHRWPVINVTRKSIEETAAAVMQLMARARDKKGRAAPAP